MVKESENAPTGSPARANGPRVRISGGQPHTISESDSDESDSDESDQMSRIQLSRMSDQMNRIKMSRLR